MDIENQGDEHRDANLAQRNADAADADYARVSPLRCAVDECDQPGTEEYRVAPRGICDPGEEERWPVVRFCKPHMHEIMAGE